MKVTHYFLSNSSIYLHENTPQMGSHDLIWYEVLLNIDGMSGLQDDAWTDSGEAPNIQVSVDKERKLGELAEFLRESGLDEELVDACSMPLNFPSVEIYGNCVFVRFPLREHWDAEEANYLTLLCLPGALISLRNSRSSLVERTLQLLRAGSRPSELSSQGLLLFILDICTDISIRQYMSARSAVEGLADLIDDKPDSVTQEALTPIRRAVGRLSSQFEDQYYCMGYCLGLLPPLQNKEASISPLKNDLREMMDSQNYVVRSQEQLEMRLRDLHNDCILHIQRKTDYRLRVLTVLTSICMPLTVVTGIYGMNFQYMPELNWPHGYFLILGLMFFLAVFLLVFFYKRGWFK